ncbi:hypothetical protein Z043_113271, partial [Scleropages formosus]
MRSSIASPSCTHQRSEFIKHYILGEENLLAILKRRWWKYMILGLIDIEANYLVIKAYQYTTLTSVQLLDCFVIPVVLLLSWFFLLVRYKAVHFVGVGVCLLGMGCMVGADVLVGRQQGLGDHKLLGDLLVLAGATLYGISNVCEEFIVKNLSRVEFLGMMGLFGSFFSGIQLAIMEHKELLKVPWDWQIGLLYVGFSACMFGLYSFMPVVIRRTSAAAVNLSLLTADLYSLFCGLFLFQYKKHCRGMLLLSTAAVIACEDGWVLEGRKALIHSPHHTALGSARTQHLLIRPVVRSGKLR